LRSDNFDSVGELYTKDDLGELAVTIDSRAGPAMRFFSEGPAVRLVRSTQANSDL
jgi:hypothetical protein